MERSGVVEIKPGKFPFSAADMGIETRADKLSALVYGIVHAPNQRGAASKQVVSNDGACLINIHSILTQRERKTAKKNIVRDPRSSKRSSPACWIPR
jgi:hypothetical protein